MPKPLPDREAKIETAKALWVQGVNFPRISQQLSVNLGTLKGWCQRQGWLQIKRNVQADIDGSVVQVVKSSLEAQSKLVRSDIADIVQSQSKAMKSAKITPNSLRNTPSGQGQASVIKTIAETADKVFGWSDNERSEVNLAMFFNMEKPVNEQVIDVETEASTV